MLKPFVGDIKNSDKIPKTVSTKYFVGIVAGIAFFLPFIVYFGDSFFYTNEWTPRSSISGYYHSGMRDWFVGFMFLVGGFLMIYEGFHYIDKWLCNIGGLAAMTLAIIPTVLGTEENNVNATMKVLTESTNKFGMHEISAGILFLALICMSLFIFTNDSKDGYWRNTPRFKIYFTCGILMLLSIIFLVYNFSRSEPLYNELQPVFVIETFCLFLFGISWGTKAVEVFELEQEQRDKQQKDQCE